MVLTKKQRKAEKSKKNQRENYGKIFAYLAKNPCVDCGETDPLKLEFDHVKGEKSDCISGGFLRRNWSRVKAEIAKCEIRCGSCHTAQNHIRVLDRRFMHFLTNEPQPRPELSRC